ncbi:ribose-phosphate diphosphokinase [Candidatus Vidania fulgoroideorum]
MLIFYKNLRTLCKTISKQLKTKPQEIKVQKYHNGEYEIKFKKQLINKKIILFFNLCKPINTNILKCNFIINFIKQAQAKTITLISPYLGYCRQDRPTNTYNRLIAAKLLAQLLETSGLNKLITVDIHSEQIAGFYTIPLINLKTTAIIKKIIKTIQTPILFPDNGSFSRFKELKLTNYTLNKIRIGRKIKLTPTNIINHHKITIIDDILDTGTTLTTTLANIKSKHVYMYITHLTSYHTKILNNNKIKRVFTTNSIQHKHTPHKITPIDLSKIILQEIKHDKNIY